LILSFHPIITADRNILFAGREPGREDLAAIQAARAVILPQGCTEALYRMARANCAHVFPNLDARFNFQGKLGQIRLFRRLGVAHPPTRLFDSVTGFHQAAPPIDFPAVIKWDWGGEGETVFKVDHPQGFAALLARTAECERSGQRGFLVQAFVPTGGRALRMAQIGRQRIDYWRIHEDARRFGSALAHGARIDDRIEPHLRAAAGNVVSKVIAQTGLQLAGFDFIFDKYSLEAGRIEPLMLEINYYFGRRGLGGSERYYAILIGEIDAWLAERGLARPTRGGSHIEADETE
jgi:ribosomal protein S6--L-glutamate ligase